MGCFEGGSTDMICTVIVTLTVLAISAALVVWLVESLRQQPAQRYQQTQYHVPWREDAPWNEFATGLFGEDEVRKMDEKYGPDYKMALLDEVLWDDFEQD